MYADEYIPLEFAPVVAGASAWRRDDTALVDHMASGWPRAPSIAINTMTTTDRAATTAISSFSSPLQRAQQPRPMSPPRPLPNDAEWNAMTGL